MPLHESAADQIMNKKRRPSKIQLDLLAFVGDIGDEDTGKLPDDVNDATEGAVERSFAERGEGGGGGGSDGGSEDGSGSSSEEESQEEEAAATPAEESIVEKPAEAPPTTLARDMDDGWEAASVTTPTGEKIDFDAIMKEAAAAVRAKGPPPGGAAPSWFPSGRGG